MKVTHLLFGIILLSFLLACLADSSSSINKRKGRKRRQRKLKRDSLHENDKSELQEYLLPDMNQEKDPQLDLQSQRKLKKERRRENRKNKVRKNKQRRNQARRKNNQERRKRRERRKLGISQEPENSPSEAILGLKATEEDGVVSGIPEEHVREGKRKRHRKRSNSRRLRRRDRHGLVEPPKRHRDYTPHGIPVGSALDPPLCPPSIGPVTSDTCIVPTCTTHRQCGGGLACCFNGCVHTCITPMDRPPVIDWLEDTSNIRPIFSTEDEVPTLPDVYKQPLYAIGEEAVHLPGGCTVSAIQYKQLKDFMEAPSIDDCMCSGGEVVCAVKMFRPALTSGLVSR